MEKIVYRKTLDTQKNGVQFTLQGFTTADKLSRVVELSLMASGDTIEMPMDDLTALMYVSTPSDTEPDILKCDIRDNKIVFEVPHISVGGITTIEAKLIKSTPGGTEYVAVAPKFAVEVSDTNANDDGEELKAKFTLLEEFIAKAQDAYDHRLERIELTSDCIFKAYYADGSEYETDILKKLFLNGNVELSKSYAIGGTGVRAGEDTDNAKYYSLISKIEALNAKSMMETSEKTLDEVRLHGAYTTFSVDFNSGEIEYVSPAFTFSLNEETGELDAKPREDTYKKTIYNIVDDWMEENHTSLKKLQADMDKNISAVATFQQTVMLNTRSIEKLETEIQPIERGGTGATTPSEAIVNLGIDKYQMPWNVDGNLMKINVVDADVTSTHAPKPVDATYHSAPDKEEISIFIKNSGTIYLKYTLNVTKGNFTAYADQFKEGIKYGFAGIYQNDKLMKSYGKDFYERFTEEQWNSGDIPDDVKPEDYAFPYEYFPNHGGSVTVTTKEVVKLYVKKGDILRLYTSVMCDGGNYTHKNTVELANISIYANGETPYTYFDLKDSNTVELKPTI